MRDRGQKVKVMGMLLVADIVDDNTDDKTLSMITG
jgi:hypothetical protein